MYTSLRLQRFKSFQDAELKLGPFTVLIGANASGKSNIRDAFRFLHGVARGYSLAEIIGEKYGEAGERVWAGIRGGIPEVAFAKASTFALEAEKVLLLPSASSGLAPFTKNPKYEKRELGYQIEVRLDRNHAMPFVSREVFRDETMKCELLGKERRKALRVEYVTREEKYDVREQPSDSPFIYSISNPLRDNLSMRFPPQDIALIVHYYLLSIQRMRFFDWSLEAMKQPSPTGQTILGDNGRNLSSVLQAICRERPGKQTLLSWVNELTPLDATDFEFPTDPTGKVLATLIERNGQRVALDSASDGTLRFLAFLAAFLGPHRPSFFFLEELENGIHPTRLGLLLDLIENQVNSRQVQVVATTHSPQLLGHLSERALESATLIYRPEDQPDSRITRLLDMPKAGQLIKKYGAADLATSGWFNDAAQYMQPDSDGEQPAPLPARQRRSRSGT